MYIAGVRKLSVGTINIRTRCIAMRSLKRKILMVTEYPIAGTIVLINTILVKKILTKMEWVTFVTTAPDVSNPDQKDENQNGIGDACERDTTSPTVTINHYPVLNIHPTTSITFNVIATDDTNVTRIVIYVNDNATECSPIEYFCKDNYWQCTWNAGRFPAGTLTYRAEAFDPAGNKGISAEKTLNVSGISPLPPRETPVPGVTPEFQCFISGTIYDFKYYSKTLAVKACEAEVIEGGCLPTPPYTCLPPMTRCKEGGEVYYDTNLTRIWAGEERFRMPGPMEYHIYVPCNKSYLIQPVYQPYGDECRWQGSWRADKSNFVPNTEPYAKDYDFYFEPLELHPPSIIQVEYPMDYDELNPTGYDDQKISVKGFDASGIEKIKIEGCVDLVDRYTEVTKEGDTTSIRFILNETNLLNFSKICNTGPECNATFNIHHALYEKDIDILYMVQLKLNFTVYICDMAGNGVKNRYVVLYKIPKEKCDDSDGNNRFVAGKVETPSISYFDRCVNDTHVREYLGRYDHNKCEVYYIDYPCPSGCENGACRETCSDGIENQDEEGIDCGGSCPVECSDCTGSLKWGGGREMDYFDLDNPSVLRAAIDAISEYVNCLNHQDCRNRLPTKIYSEGYASGNYSNFVDCFESTDCKMEAVAYYVDKHMHYMYDPDDYIENICYNPYDDLHAQSAGDTIENSGSRSGRIGALYLFDMDIRFENTLNAEIISEDLKNTFRANGVRLTNHATVDKKDDDKWKINDEENYEITKVAPENRTPWLRVLKVWAAQCPKDYCGDCEDHAILREALMRALHVSGDCAFVAEHYKNYWGGGHVFNLVKYRNKWRVMDYGPMGSDFLTNWNQHEPDNIWNDEKGVFFCPDARDNCVGKRACDKKKPPKNYENNFDCPLEENKLESVPSKQQTYRIDLCP